MKCDLVMGWSGANAAQAPELVVPGLGASTLGLMDALGCLSCPSTALMPFSSRLAAEVQLTNKDPRWVGAWWLGFLVAASLVALSALPYFFFPREMPKEVGERPCTHTHQGCAGTGCAGQSCTPGRSTALGAAEQNRLCLHRSISAGWGAAAAAGTRQEVRLCSSQCLGPAVSGVVALHACFTLRQQGNLPV